MEFWNIDKIVRSSGPVIARSGATKQSNKIKRFKMVRLLRSARNDNFLTSYEVINIVKAEEQEKTKGFVVFVFPVIPLSCSLLFAFPHYSSIPSFQYSSSLCLCGEQSNSQPIQDEIEHSAGAEGNRKDRERYPDRFFQSPFLDHHEKLGNAGDK